MKKKKKNIKKYRLTAHKSQGLRTQPIESLLLALY